jgi:hypothetical protein
MRRESVYDTMLSAEFSYDDDRLVTKLNSCWRTVFQAGHMKQGYLKTLPAGQRCLSSKLSDRERSSGGQCFL